MKELYVTPSLSLYDMKKLYVAALDKIVTHGLASEMHKPLDPGQATVKQPTLHKKGMDAKAPPELKDKALALKNLGKVDIEKLNVKEDFHLFMKKEYEKIANEEWFFDKITHQRAEELLIEKGGKGDFMVREDLEQNNFFLTWLNQKKYIKHVCIVMNRETRKYNLEFTNDQKLLDSQFKSQYNTFSEVLQDLKDHNIIKKTTG